LHHHKNIKPKDEQALEVWHAEYQQMRERVREKIAATISNAEASTYSVAGDVSAYTAKGINAKHQKAFAVLSRDVEHLEDIVRRFGPMVRQQKSSSSQQGG
jgi:F0F1-type ATP synthase membrane subunit b/b'